jgi:serine/threonine-protein kinase
VVGTTIGSYQILSRLGAGAMGEVYLAEHRHLKRKAAIKFLAREIMGRPDLLERFFLEARATSAIAHPGIVQVFDCEVDPNGRPYIVMELLEGQTLAGLLQRGALSPAIAARLARSMAGALHAAHAKGIIHRDIKPDNVFVQAQVPDAVKLVDFGIAKLAGDFRAGQVHMTQTGALMGTPLYMSPEQCRDAGKIDFRTDLYSLGCVMFEMLTGRPPFTHELMGDLVVAHMTEEPQSVCALNPAVPPALAELVAELLRKDPAQRPADMQVVADRLSTFLASVTTLRRQGHPVSQSEAGGQAASAAPDGGAGAKVRTTFGGVASELVTPDAARARGRRIAMAVIAGCAGVALAAVGILAARGHGGRTPDAPPAAVAAPPAPAAAPVKPEAPTPSRIAAPAPSAPSPAAAPPGHEASAGHAKRRVAPRTAEPSAPASDADKLASLEPLPPPPPPPPPPVPHEGRKSDVGVVGTWEGPWNDAAHQQQGRLFVQVGADGAVAGWMFNSAAGQSYRMTGHMSSDGALDLVCLCPEQQNFTVRGTLAGADHGELHGRLVLSTAAGAFGQSQVTLRRAPPR